MSDKDETEVRGIVMPPSRPEYSERSDYPQMSRERRFTLAYEFVRRIERGSAAHIEKFATVPERASVQPASAVRLREYILPSLSYFGGDPNRRVVVDSIMGLEIVADPLVPPGILRIVDGQGRHTDVVLT